MDLLFINEMQFEDRCILLEKNEEFNYFVEFEENVVYKIRITNVKQLDDFVEKEGKYAIWNAKLQIKKGNYVYFI